MGTLFFSTKSYSLPQVTWDHISQLANISWTWGSNMKIWNGLFNVLTLNKSYTIEKFRKFIK